MNNRKAYSFFMEIIFSILFFAICSSVCLKVFASAKVMSDKADNLNNATVIAQNYAECYKAYNGNIDKMMKKFNGKHKNKYIYFYEDKYIIYIVGNRKHIRLYVAERKVKNYKKNSILTMNVGNGGL